MIKKIRNELEENPYFDCKFCFLRGSYANEAYYSSSDVDLLIVSPVFKDISMLKRKELVNKSIYNLDTDIKFDAICLSEDEYYSLINSKREMFFKERMVKII